MKQGEQQIAIARACGWVCLAGHDYVPPRVEIDLKFTEPLPDYCNDLNAMHEAEKSLTPAQFRDYRKRLNWRKDYGVTAEAFERAEDFLKAINKWTNDT